MAKPQTEVSTSILEWVNLLMTIMCHGHHSDTRITGFACCNLWIDNMLSLPWVKNMEMSSKYLLDILPAACMLVRGLLQNLINMGIKHKYLKP